MTIKDLNIVFKKKIFLSDTYKYELFQIKLILLKSSCFMQK